MDHLELTEHINTPAEILRYTRWGNLQNYKQHKAVLSGFYNLLTAIPQELANSIGLNQHMLNAAREAYKEQHLQASKTFTVCPTCDKALTGKKRSTKHTKSMTDYNCNICGAQAKTYLSTHRKIHHSTSLSEANTYVRTAYPELLI